MHHTYLYTTIPPPPLKLPLRAPCLPRDLGYQLLVNLRLEAHGGVRSPPPQYFKLVPTDGDE